MALRKPSTKKVGIKVLVTGQTGAGKSIFGLSFPKIAALDSEAGLALYEGKEKGKNLELIDNTMSVKDMEETFEEITDLLDDDAEAVKTLLIDSETKFYQNLQHSCLETEEKRARAKGGNADDANLSQRSWGRIKQISSKLQNLKIDLSAKGVNVVSVSQVDDVKEKKGENFVKVGEKPVMAKGAEYDYDIVIDLFKEETKDGVIYKGKIKKDRTGVTAVGDIIENPSYAIWEEHLEGRKNAEKLNTNLAKDFAKDVKNLEEEDEKKSEADGAINSKTNTELLAKISAYIKSDDADEDVITKLGALFKATGFKTNEVDKIATEVYRKAIALFE